MDRHQHDQVSPAGRPTAQPWLSTTDIGRVDALLRQCGLLDTDDQVVGLGRAGEGNMNLTLRVRTNRRTLIVKQSRPWVEKYPHIPAPLDRVHFECRFYQAVHPVPAVAGRMPALLAALPDQWALVLEDLGPAADCTPLYARPIPDGLVRDLLQWLSALHALPATGLQPEDMNNRALRELNHAHLFVVPFQFPPVMDLDRVTPGLAAVAAELSDDRTLKSVLHELGERYLASGPCLVHGDFFPGSWLLPAAGLRIIDPEFCFLGRPEWDLAVLVAHLRLMRQRPSPAELAALYAGPAIDWALVEAWASVEVLRRLLGVAQLPLDRSLDEKQELIANAVERLRRG